MRLAILNLLVLLILVLTPPTTAHEFVAARPAKAPTQVVSPPPDPARIRQGGDTILAAVMLTPPVFNLPGTTVGYTDDYDEVCPYDGSTSPDVVYTFIAGGAGYIDVDLYGSTYDTKVYVYDENLALVACNDDFYPDYTSRLDMVPVNAGEPYFVVIDGFGGDAGDYLLSIWPWWDDICHIECPPGGITEDEPPLAVDYEDTWNGGCNTDSANPPFQPITSPIFCGVAGWYIYQGNDYRDTDWFTIEIPAAGVLEVVGDAEYATYMYELGPQDCDTVGVLQNVPIGPCSEATMIITGPAGATVWFWVGSQTFTSPYGADVQEYDYVLWTNLVPVATQNHSWSRVKALFD